LKKWKCKEVWWTTELNDWYQNDNRCGIVTMGKEFWNSIRCKDTAIISLENLRVAPLWWALSLHTNVRLVSRCDISLSILRFTLLLNKGFHNLDPPCKRTTPFGAKITRADSTLKRLLPRYFSIQIFDPDRKSSCTI